MSMVKCRYGFLAAKSRSDDTLLTVDFNLRTRNAIHLHQVLQGRHSHLSKVSSLQDLRARRDARVRRLKPTVNKVLSHAGHFIVDMTLLLPDTETLRELMEG
jgi:hypothetical protein